MAEAKRAAAFRSMVVALDASVHSIRILESAAALAEQLRIDLEALLVEDENLLRLADLPFAREINRTSGTERSLDAGRLNRALRARSERFQRAIDRVAASGLIRAQLRVVRGHYLAEALSATTGTDVLFLGSAGPILRGVGVRYTGRESGNRSSSDATAKRSVDRSTCCVLHSGTEAAVRALELARKLGESQSSPLTLLIPASTIEQAARLRQNAERILAGTPQAHKFVNLRTTDGNSILRNLRGTGCSLLIVPRDDADAATQQVTALQKGLDCPIVLVG